VDRLSCSSQVTSETRTPRVPQVVDAQPTQVDSRYKRAPSELLPHRAHAETTATRAKQGSISPLALGPSNQQRAPLASARNTSSWSPLLRTNPARTIKLSFDSKHIALFVIVAILKSACLTDAQCT